MSALQDLAGKVAVVTGGASGIGRGIATQLIAQGMTVVIADIEASTLEATAKAIGATPIRTDVSDYASVQALADETKRQFGTAHLVCNNAGVGSLASIAEMTIKDWQWVLGVNLWGVIHGINAFLPMLQANTDGGHIVNTSSMGGLATMPGLGGYAASKSAVVAITETLAQELEMAGSKVGATVLCPGTVHTNIKNSSRNRPAGLEGALADVDLENSEYGAAVRWIQPEEVGDIVIRAVTRGDLYAITHPDMAGPIEDRHRRISGAMSEANAFLFGQPA